jgi:hypothetical protein
MPPKLKKRVASSLLVSDPKRVTRSQSRAPAPSGMPVSVEVSTGENLAMDASPETMLRYIQRQPREQQYHLLEQLNATMEQHEGHLLDLRAELIEYMESEKLWQYHLRQDIYEEVWSRAKLSVRQHQEQKDRIATAVQTITHHWGQDVWDRVFADQNAGYPTFSAIRAFAKECQDWNLASRIILSVYHYRMVKRTRGQRSATEILASDWRNAMKMLAELRAGNSELTADEVLYEHEHVAEHAKLMLPRLISLDTPLKKTLPQTRDEPLSPDIPTKQVTTTNPASVSVQNIANKALNLLSESLDVDDTVVSQNPTGNENEEQEAEPELEVIRPQDQPDDDEPTGNEDEEQEADPELEVIRPQDQPDEHEASCKHCHNISADLIGDIERKDKAIPKIVATLARIMEEEGLDVDRDARLCYAHKKMLGGTIGLRLRTLTTERLDERFRMIWRQRANIAKLKTGKDTWAWFRASDRPPRAADNMGHFNYVHEEPECDFIDHDAIRDWLMIQSDGNWEKDGSVIIGDMFEWLFEEDTAHVVPISQLLTDEFDMYWHHLRQRGGQSNYGWLRNMYHGIFQQVVRQSPAYYLAYVALRQDHNHRLISYPYYTKYQQTGDSTSFRHIDLNIPQLVNNQRGYSLIQGSVSLDDEEPDDCTELLLGMHKHLKQWWREVSGRLERKGKKPKDGAVIVIRPEMWDKRDIRKYGIDFTPQPCHQGQARVSLPHLPHGALGPAKRSRRTILPWYMGIQEDHETLDTIEAGTWSQLSGAHRDLLPGPTSPSGLHNLFGQPPYAFPAAVPVTGLGPISDALVGRIRWDNPLVLQDLELLLGPLEQPRNQYIQEWIWKARVEIRLKMRIVEETERARFGDKSFFDCRDRRARAPTPDDPPPNAVPDAVSG